jgi:hypothetical protein
MYPILNPKPNGLQYQWVVILGVIKMQAIKATVQDGNVILNERVDIKGRFDAVLVLLDPDPWESLVQDPRVRPELVKARQEALQDHAEGKASPLDPDKMP